MKRCKYCSYIEDGKINLSSGEKPVMRLNASIGKTQVISSYLYVESRRGMIPKGDGYCLALYDEISQGHIGSSININYCPVCGRKLEKVEVTK